MPFSVVVLGVSSGVDSWSPGDVRVVMVKLENVCTVGDDQNTLMYGSSSRAAR